MSGLERLLSKIKTVQIQIERFLDHNYRKITGLPSRRRSEITLQLFVGGQFSDLGLERLKAREFTAVVNMRLKTSNILQTKIERLGLRYLHLPTVDMQAPSLEHLYKGVEFIEKEIESGGKIYVHCRGGEGRGPSMAIAYLIRTGLTFEDALATVKKVRTFVRPTKVQREQLKIFELELRASKDKDDS